MMRVGGQVSKYSQYEKITLHSSPVRLSCTYSLYMLDKDSDETCSKIYGISAG